MNKDFIDGMKKIGVKSFIFGSANPDQFLKQFITGVKDNQIPFELGKAIKVAPPPGERAKFIAKSTSDKKVVSVNIIQVSILGLLIHFKDNSVMSQFKVKSVLRDFAVDLENNKMILSGEVFVVKGLVVAIKFSPLSQQQKDLLCPYIYRIWNGTSNKLHTREVEKQVKPKEEVEEKARPLVKKEAKGVTLDNQGNILRS